MYFDTVENEPPIMNQIQCKPLCVPSCTTMQKIRNKQWIILDNYHFKVTPPIQDTCMEGLLFECPTYTAKLRYIKIKDTVAIMAKPVSQAYKHGHNYCAVQKAEVMWLMVCPLASEWHSMAIEGKPSL